MFNTVPQMLFEKAKEIPTAPIQYSKNKAGTFEPVSYIDFAQLMFYFASGLITLGNSKDNHIGLISDNRKEWLVCSMGIMALGCADIPRGSEATVKDLSYILSFSECRTVIVENNYSYKKILECREELKTLQNVVIIDPTGADKSAIDVPVYTYDEVIEAGKKYRSENPGKIEEIYNAGKEDEIATIIFTSDTTGVPKGVELTHKNFLCQIKALTENLPLRQGDKSLAVLPIWHVYEREMEYYLLANGCSLCYSKPVVSMILADFQKIQPQFMACVPRIWDGIFGQIEKKAVNKSKRRKILFKLCTGAAIGRLRIRAIIYGKNARYRKDFWLTKILNKVLYLPLGFLLPLVYLGELMFFKQARNVFGGSFKIAISGGGGIAPKLDRFYNAIGIRLVEGYGLTETAPMISLRNYKRAVLGTIGRPLDFCEIKVVNRHGVECAPGQLGVLYVRGPNVMRCYHKQPELTAEVLQEGWFNTGDLVVRTITGEISIKGRAKDTIVLRSGENVEPLPIENKLVESPYIAQAVVVGQDQNCLGALIIPNKDNLKKFAEENNIPVEPFAALLKNDLVYDLIFKELERLVTPKTGFKPFEKIGKFAFLEKPFELGVELTAKGTVQRFKVQEMYKWQIASMFSESVFAQGFSNFTGNLKDLGSKTTGLLHKR